VVKSNVSPFSDNFIAMAQAVTVLPTPPFRVMITTWLLHFFASKMVETSRESIALKGLLLAKLLCMVVFLRSK